MLNRKSRKSLSPEQQQAIRQQQHWLLKLWLTLGRASTLCPDTRQSATSGFILPTTIFVLLVTALVMGAMVFRSYNRTREVAGERRESTIYNAATPAIDRARAKLEYLFTKDARLPSGRVRDDQLAGIILNSGAGGVATDASLDSLYLLPGETWLTEADVGVDFDESGGTPSASKRIPGWRFTDPNTNTTTAYMILFDIDRNGATIGSSDATKAANLIIRNGPIAAEPSCQGTGALTATGSGGGNNNDGWFDIGSSGQSKRAFQIMAVTLPTALTDGNPANNPPETAIATLQYQQDRELAPGNTYGAWFRYDLEISPGPDFRWNGRLYSAASVLTTPEGNTNLVRYYLISDNESCYYPSPENSEIAAGGLFGLASVQNNSWTGTVRVDLHPGNSNAPSAAQQNVSTTTTNDAVNHASIQVEQILADPVQMVTLDKTLPRGITDPDGTGPQTPYGSVKSDTWDNSDLALKRISVQKILCPPYVDDAYRADNRYGPKPTYQRSTLLNGECQATPFSQEQGSLATDPALITDTPPSDPVTGLPGAPDNVGTDGYWERRARNEGLRIIVGQRLELGNTHNWINEAVGGKDVTGDGDTNDLDPLNPPPANAAANSSMANRAHEQRQWRTLRDNLAAVQSLAVYHMASGNSDFPVACVAATAHPGTEQSIANSQRFTLPQTPGGAYLPSTIDGIPTVYTSFLTGQGTNGWEFRPPGDGTITGFTTAVNTASSPLRKALKNLAYFAGDPFGAFPPYQDSNDGVNSNDAVPAVGPVVHPYPNLTMWGNFSNLRRIITALEGGTSYANLSPADKTTLHTASCTVQMLANNLRLEDEIFKAVLADSTINWTSLGVKLRQLMDMNNITNGSPIIGRPKPNDPNYKAPGLCKGTSTGSWIPNLSNPNWTGCPAVNPNSVAQTDTTNPYHPINYFSQFTTDEWITALSGLSPGLSASEQAALKLLVTGSQIRRDRSLGFAKGAFTGDLSGNFDPNGGIWTNPTSGSDKVDAGEIDPGDKYKMGCDPRLFAQGELSSGNAGARLGLALVLCGFNNPPKYPSLYYLFPVTNHDHDGNNDTATGGLNHTQPQSEPYIDNDNNTNTAFYTKDNTVNGAYTYQAITDTEIKTLSLVPRPRANWVLPNATGDSGRVNRIVDNYTTTGTSTYVYTAFLDKGIFNGREQMGVRVLDIDLDLLRSSTSGLTGDVWLPYRGLVYAFREDAMREDGIARPRRNVSFAACDQFYASSGTPELFTTNCLMNAVGATPQDPPLYLSNASYQQGISIKPIDMFPDPDRRPHGFRLRKGINLRRTPTPPPEFQLRGMTFVSDNSAYIMTDDGAFNPHQTPGGTSITDSIEEFITQLATPANWANFYTRGSSGVNTKFAGINDNWRPTEILADGITILSQNFVDGWIAQGILTNKGFTNNDPTQAGLSSYSLLNSPKPTAAPYDATNPGALPWVREDGTVSNIVQTGTANPSPIKFSQRNFPVYCATAGNPPLPSDPGLNQPCAGSFTSTGTPRMEVEYGLERPNTTPSGSTSDRDFETFTDNNNNADQADQIKAAANQRVAAMIVSGIHPSRRRLTYGGMHNFPRFLEDWSGQDLFITGALMQLSFSTQATGLYDHDANAWEPTTNTPASGSNLPYYRPPNRRWGYDVGLQYAPASPLALRMQSLSNARDEFYRQLPTSDPYVCRLRQALNYPCQ